MTCSFAMRGSRKSLFDAGLNRSTRLESSQTPRVVGGFERRLRRRNDLDPWPSACPGGGTVGGAAVRSPHRSIDFLWTAGGARGGGGGLRGVAVAVTVGGVVGERQRGLELELQLEAGAALLPALLVLQLVLVQRRRLLDAVRVAELDGQLGGRASHLVPRRAERELVGDGADAPRVDVAGQRDGRQDRPRPVRRLRVDRHRQDVQVVAAAAVAGDHRRRRPRRGDLPRRRPVALREREEHRIVLAAVGEALLRLDVVQPLGRADVAELVLLALLVAAPDARDDEARGAREPLDVVEVLGWAPASMAWAFVSRSTISKM